MRRHQLILSFKTRGKIPLLRGPGPSGHNQNSSNSAHLTSSLSWFNRHCWGDAMRKKGKDEQEEVAKNKNWRVLNDM